MRIRFGRGPSILASLAEGEALHSTAGPCEISFPAESGHPYYEAALATGLAIAPYQPPPPPVPKSISDRQFSQQLAIDGVITEAEALAWAARGDLPAALETIVAQLGDQQFGARMLLSAATAYERGHPLTTTLGGLLGYNASQLDALWRAASAL